ncbi:DoxX family protein [Parasphingopyxis algicola]|uniref:DoxX family protein n=1 Tax=Parasphingopyxis algicola TaxID=2026624 RepID=UPI0015A10A01|nr:DoxX family protein [Parasphingopyxis algicola]QLC25159.1 DoxX family protein [Parasphingopyxis algicola]
MVVLVGRILLGALFVMAGAMKFGNIEGLGQFIESGGLPAMLAWPTAIFEVVAGLAIVVGFLTRYAALALAAFCVATGLLYHPGEMGEIMKNIALAGGFLILYSHGAGLLSIDARRGGTD